MTQSLLEYNFLQNLIFSFFQKALKRRTTAKNFTKSIKKLLLQEIVL